MVAPKTRNDKVFSLTGALVHTRSGWKQKRPFNLNLPLEARYCKQVPTLGSCPISAINGWTSERDPGNIRIRYPGVYTQAYERYIGKIKEGASWANALAEHKQARQMIGQRAVQLLDLYRAIRRFDIGTALDIVGVSKRTWRQRQRRSTQQDQFKNVSNLWLEFHFGWSPLLKDVYTGLEVIADHVPPWRVRASARSYFPGTRGKPHPGGNAEGTYYWEGPLTVRVKLGATLEVSNRNLWLANSLGLINPLGVAWEITPFSFVADWFTNVGTVVNGLTDTYGLSISDGFTTGVTNGENWAGYCYRGIWLHQGYLHRVWVNRKVGAPSVPRLGFRTLKIPSWQRVATTFSLIGQMMRDDGEKIVVTRRGSRR